MGMEEMADHDQQAEWMSMERAMEGFI